MTRGRPTTTRSATQRTTYREAYATLSRIAAELESGDADLDAVLPLLEEAREAYAQCRERIEAVRAVLSSEWAGELEEDAGDADDEEEAEDDEAE